MRYNYLAKFPQCLMFSTKPCLRVLVRPARQWHTAVTPLCSLSSHSNVAVLAANHGSHVHLSRRRCLPRTPFRTAKTKASLKLDDLPQGAIALDSIPVEDDAPQYPTVVLQARTNMRKFENCVLLTRVGGFYELYFEQAEEFGPLLNLKVAQKKTNAGPVSMVRLLIFLHSPYCN